jgi:hypothetical protein
MHARVGHAPAPDLEHPVSASASDETTTSAADEPAAGPRKATGSGGAPPALLDDPAVSTAISAHADAEVALVEAKHRLTRAREAVRNALFTAGKRYRDRQLPLPRPDLHRLYWDHRELRTSDLSNAFGISSAELARLAGPAEGYVRCGDCQQVVPMLLDSRTPKPTYGPPVRCSPCRDHHDAREERERQRQHELDLARVAAGESVLERGANPVHGRSPYDERDW